MSNEKRTDTPLALEENRTKYQALDIANYILWYVNEDLNNQDPSKKVANLSNLKLQKLLYYVASAFLLKNKEMLFDEHIEKWQYGPVTPSVYYAYQSYGSRHIPSPRSDFSFDSDRNIQVVDFDHGKIDPEICELIKETLEKHVWKAPFTLVNLTHAETIWAKDRDKIENGTQNIPYKQDEWLQFLENNH